MTDVPTRFLLAPHAVAQHLGNELVILNTATEEFVTLNPVGAVIWDSLERESTAGAALSAVLNRFDGVTIDQAKIDIDIFLARLLDLGVVLAAPADGA